MYNHMKVSQITWDSLWNTKYPRIFGILPSCPPYTCPDTVSRIPGYSGSSPVVPPTHTKHSVRDIKYLETVGILYM